MPRGLIVQSSQPSDAAWMCDTTDGFSRISRNRIESPRIEMCRICPFRALTLEDRRPARSSRARSGNRPVSSTRHEVVARLAWPAFLSALTCVSSVPVADSIDTRIRTDRRILSSSPDASAISATWRRSSAALPLSKLAIAPRQPGRRERTARGSRDATTAAIALISRSFERCSVPTFMRGPTTAKSQSRPRTSGSAIGRPESGCPGGTIECGGSPTQPARPPGSAWSDRRDRRATRPPS